METDYFNILMKKFKNNIDFYTLILQERYPQPLQDYLIDQAVTCLNKVDQSQLFSYTFENYHIKNIISIYSKTTNKNVKYCLIKITVDKHNLYQYPSFVNLIIDDLNNDKIYLDNMMSYPTPIDDPIAEKFYNAIFDYWVRHGCPEHYYTGYFLSYQSIIEKYEKYNFKNLYLTWIVSTSKLTLEQLCEKLNRSVSESYMAFDLRKIPISYPVNLFKLTKSVYDRNEIAENPCLKSDDIFTMFNLTTSQLVKNTLLQHPNCPETLKLKHIVK